MILGRLTNAIISHDPEYLKNNLILIRACLVFKIICEPLIFAFFLAKSGLGSCGFANIASGELLTDGKLPEKAAFSTISLASQSSTLFGYAEIRENILLGCLGKENATCVDDLMATYRLENSDTDICDLSGGEAQKAKILRALIKDAELLILDEPENHLDENTLRQLTRELAGYKKSVLIYYHLYSAEGI